MPLSFEFKLVEIDPVEYPIGIFPDSQRLSLKLGVHQAGAAPKNGWSFVSQRRARSDWVAEISLMMISALSEPKMSRGKNRRKIIFVKNGLARTKCRLKA